MSLDTIRTGLTFDDVLLVPRRSGIRSRSDVSLETALTKRIRLGLPVIAANMDTVCETEMAVAMARLGGIGIIHRFLTIEAQAAMVVAVKAADGVAGVGAQSSRDQTGRDRAGRDRTGRDRTGRSARGNALLVGAAVGTDHDALDRSFALVEAGANVLVLDIAHGHADHAIEVLAKIKAAHPEVDVIAGNVATRAGAQDLVTAGADAVKVGVGPGGVCTTRLVAGVGVPQLTAINDCAGLVDAEGQRVPVIADGGIRASGDIAKALAAGASTVMMGSMLAGTKESPGDLEQSDRGLVKRVRGMASFEALEARAAREGESIDAEYFEQRAPEGVEGSVPYRGEVGKLLGSLMAGVRSGMSYSDARSIEELWEKAEFIRVTPSVVAMNRPHATGL